LKPIKYRVLVCRQLSKADKTEVVSKVSTIYSGPEAFANSFQQDKKLIGIMHHEHWQYEIKDHLGRIGILKFKGVEVAIYVQRQIAIMEPLPMDPVPEGVIEDPKDAWVRFDLLGAEPKTLAVKMSKVVKQGETLLSLADKELAAKKILIDELQHEVFKLTMKLEKYEKKAAKKAKAVTV
jgi:hypothetical protein